jgi:dATP pyrophosphohydrolase
MNDGRAPFQILVLVVDISNYDALEYLILRREPETGGYWQGIAGGGEGDETPEQAACRETEEETGIVADAGMIELEAQASIPVKETFGSYLWGPDVTEIPEYAFGLKVVDRQIVLSDEHDQYRWALFEAALERLHWESNRKALAELHKRILARRA